jgi:tetratricopeptide (TPR) repeat protein
MRPAKLERATKKRTLRLVALSIAALVILAGLAVTAAFWKSSAKRRLVALLRPTVSRVSDAEEAYRKGDWERAADLSRALIKSKSESPEVLRTYARASARLGRDLAAATTYNERLGLDKLQQEDCFLFGLVFQRAGDPDKALKLWLKAVEIGPDNPELLEQLMRLWIQLRRLDEAGEVASRLARQPGWEARGLLELGKIQSWVDNPRAAAVSLRDALKRDPAARGAPFEPVHYERLLARNLLQLGRPAEARQPLESVLASVGLPGVDPEANWLLSRAFLQEGRISDASAALERAKSYRADHPLAAEPSPFVGAAKCATCHAEINRSHVGSRHARTVRYGQALLEQPVPDHPLADPDDPKVTHTFTRDQKPIEVTTRAGDQVFSTIVEYAFGAPGHYNIMIGRDEERTFRALRLSSYPTPTGTGWDRTSGDVRASEGAGNIRGEPIDIRDGVVRCLYCHVTRYRDFREPPPEEGAGPTAADSGIGCERCHGPGANHLAAVKADFSDPAIVNAGNATAAMITEQCADCHAVDPSSVISRAPEDPRYIRSTAVTLTFSRCYTESDGGMSCLTCHDPHRDDQGPAAFFEAKCLACHSGQKSAGASAAGRPCPVNPAKNCLDCHMPKIPVPALHTSLTDHYIRIRKSSK